MNEAGLCDQWQDEQEAEQRNCLVSWQGGARLVEVATIFRGTPIVKLRQGSGKERQGMTVKAKGLKA